MVNSPLVSDQASVCLSKAVEPEREICANEGQTAYCDVMF